MRLGVGRCEFIFALSNPRPVSHVANLCLGFLICNTDEHHLLRGTAEMVKRESIWSLAKPPTFSESLATPSQLALAAGTRLAGRGNR